MGIREAYRAARNWGPFVARTAGYGAVSLALGPLTREHGASLWAMRRWCTSSVRGLGIEVAASGLENVPASGSFVYCSNHQSLVDILVLGSVLPGDYKWAAKRSLMKVPVIGWHLKLAGHVPVDRGVGSSNAAHVAARFCAILRRGKPLLIFPEGTRSEDGIVRPFKVGAFAAAVGANVPIVPIALEGTHRLMRKGAFDLGPGEIRHVALAIGKPLLPRQGGDETARIDDLRRRTHAAILALHRSIGGRGGEATPAAPEAPSADDAREPGPQRGSRAATSGSGGNASFTPR
jgi:1-acyl-sn-glycerol-3-phosphate acyltransferase